MGRRVVGWICGLSGLATAIVTACVGTDQAPPFVILTGDAGPGATTTSDGGPTGSDGASADGSCGDTTSDEANCGACGHRCKAGVGCLSGRCGNAIADLSLGESTACAVTAGGHVYCWGENRDGLVGDPTSSANHNRAYRIAQDAEGNPFEAIVEVTVGSTHACARKQNGSIWCWGQKQAQEFVGGNGALASSMNLSGYKRVAAGQNFTCAIDGSDVVQCWGKNDAHTLGHPRGTNGDTNAVHPGTWTNGAPRPVELPDAEGNLRAADLAVGITHACAVELMTKRVWCWGQNEEAVLGAGDEIEHDRPVNVAAVTGASTIIASARHSCVILDGSLRCWGSNLYGDIGTGDRTTPLLAPSIYGGLSGVTSGAGSSAVICALAPPSLYCSGLAIIGSVGHGSFQGDAGSDVPRATLVQSPDGGAPIAGVERVVASGVFACAQTSDQRIFCWGGNNAGQLGNGTAGTAANSATPVAVLGLP